MGLQDKWNGLEIEKNLPKGRGSLHLAFLRARQATSAST